MKALALLMATVMLLAAACMPSVRTRTWEIRMVGSADSVAGSYLAGDTKSAESHSIRAALPFRLEVIGGTIGVSAFNGSRPGDTLRIEIWEGGKLRRSAVGRSPREQVTVSAVN